MTRVFARGELRQAILEVLAATGPTNGYTIMQRLSEAVGAGWRASPGAIYPALLALEDGGHVVGRDEDGSRLFALTDRGRSATAAAPGVLDLLPGRAAAVADDRTLGDLLDEFAGGHPRRASRVDPEREHHVLSVLAAAGREIATTIDRGEPR